MQALSAASAGEEHGLAIVPQVEENIETIESLDMSNYKKVEYTFERFISSKKSISGGEFNKFHIFQRSRYLNLLRPLGTLSPSSHPHLPEVCCRSQVLKFLSVPWTEAKNIWQEPIDWESLIMLNNAFFLYYFVILSTGCSKRNNV